MNEEKTETPKLPRIYQCLADINAEVSAIGKDRQNQQQGFKFRGIDDVMNELHALFAKHRVMIIPKIGTYERFERATKSGGLSNHYLVRTEWTLLADDGSFVTIQNVGEAADSGDKAFGKAMSYGLKFALLQAFLIPTEEEKDPDARTVEFKREPVQVSIGRKTMTVAKTEKATIKENVKFTDVKVTEMEIKNGTRKDGVKWEAAICKLSDGTRCGTFDKDLFGELEIATKQQVAVNIACEKADGKFTIVGLEPFVKQEVPSGEKTTVTA